MSVISKKGSPFILCINSPKIRVNKLTIVDHAPPPGKAFYCLEVNYAPEP
ncbi:MAG: hypothetical protein JWM59_2474 [Verrucomicrobiales bacterium]|nr:hypothetical protein [Verrucomicrobiales bacterium]